MKIINHSPETVESFNSDLNSVFTELEEAHYLFIVADKEKASLFLFDKGEVVLKKNISDPSVQKKIRTDSGELNGGNTKLTHRINNELQDHVQLIMKEVEIFCKGKHISGVFLGGHKPIFHILKEELPANLQEKYRGEFVTELNILEHDLILHCKKVLADYSK